MAARSPGRSMAGPLVVWMATPSSRAMMLASVVLPRPGRAVEQDVVGRLPALARRREQDARGCP